MVERTQNLRRIVYDPTDVPAPTFAGGVLWVFLFFLPVPLLLLVHWYFTQQQPASIWLRLVSVLTFGDWRTGLVAAFAFSACVGLIAWLLRSGNEEFIAFVQSITDNAGLAGFKLTWMIVPPLLTVPLVLLRKMGVIELALMFGAEAALLATRTIARFPKPQIFGVPSDLLVAVEELKKGKGVAVSYSWEFMKDPALPASKVSFTMTTAFSAERMDEIAERDRSLEQDADFLRWVNLDLRLPEIYAIADQLNELNEKENLTPFQRAMNVLAFVSSLKPDEQDSNLPVRFPVETLRERVGTSGDLVMTAATLLRALGKTVPEAVLVLREDGRAIALGIAGAKELPKNFHGFEHGGDVYFFCLPKRAGSRWQWHVGQRLSGWENIRVLQLPIGEVLSH